MRKGNWSGDYSSWGEAAVQTFGCYPIEFILEKVKEALLKVQAGEAVFERDSVVFQDTNSYYWHALTSLLWMTSLNGNSLHVLDFGGSLGTTYFHNRQFFSHLKSFSWNIVEQEAFARCGREYFETDTLRFYTSVSDVISVRDISIFFFSGCIQYLESPHELLASVAEYRKPIFIDRTPYFDAMDDRLSIQRPESIYPDYSCPMWIFSRNKFEAFVVETLGYSIHTTRTAIDGAYDDCTFSSYLLLPRS